jgi:hypothetical protein
VDSYALTQGKHFSDGLELFFILELRKFIREFLRRRIDLGLLAELLPISKSRAIIESDSHLSLLKGLS